MAVHRSVVASNRCWLPLFCGNIWIHMYAIFQLFHEFVADRERNMSERKSTHLLEQIHSTVFYEDKTKMVCAINNKSIGSYCAFFADFLFLGWFLDHKNWRAHTLALNRQNKNAFAKSHKNWKKMWFCLSMSLLPDNKSFAFTFQHG